MVCVGFGLFISHLYNSSSSSFFKSIIGTIKKPSSDPHKTQLLQPSLFAFKHSPPRILIHRISRISPSASDSILALVVVDSGRARFRFWVLFNICELESVMGCFSCFDSKEEQRLNQQEDKHDRRDFSPASVASNNFSKLSSGGDKLKARNNVGIRRESSVPKELQMPDVNIAAHTFTFRELASATKNFRPESFIGEGGFGRVYKGQLENGQVVAVKQLDKDGLQGNREFLVEVLMLSLLHHPNLVNLIGYCADGDQRLLVYEFMPLGSLEDHLHDVPDDKEPLDWNTRMKIAAGAAKGLEYLHDKANPPVIYRDFKSSNILLEEEFHPKLSDFGLAKLGPTGDKSHVSTRVMGTYGYCAPEYAMTGQLTVKSDVYSFGVVFLELITGRQAIDSTRPHGEQNLVAWARPMFNDRKKFVKLADPLLQGKFPMRGLYQALAVASMCIQENASARPLIGDVVTALSYLANHDERRTKDESGGKIGRNEEGGSSGRKWDLQSSDKDDSPRDTARMLDRERAVAEAKMWGENLREKRRLSEQGTADSIQA